MQLYIDAWRFATKRGVRGISSIRKILSALHTRQQVAKDSGESDRAITRCRATPSSCCAPEYVNGCNRPAAALVHTYRQCITKCISGSDLRC